MNFRLSAILLLFASASPLTAQEKYVPENPLRVHELRLQEQRAAALRTRLVLYTDELQKMRTGAAAENKTSVTAAADAELAATRKAIARLSAPSGERLPDEKDLPENTSAAALVARRVDGVMQEFRDAGRDATLAAAAGRARVRILKIADAKKGESSFSHGDGRDYWTYKDSAATWTLNDLEPGVYEVEARYSTGEKGGGSLQFSAAKQQFNFTVPAGPGMNKKLMMTICSQLKITEPGVDLRIQGVSRREGASYYWGLEEIVLRPTALTRPRSTP